MLDMRINAPPCPRGGPHDTVSYAYDTLRGWKYGNGWRVLVCQKCGTTVDRWFPVSWGTPVREKPNWVQP